MLDSLSLIFLPKLDIIIKEKNKYHLTASFLRNSVHQLKSPVNYFPLVSYFHFLQRNSSVKAFWKQVICLLMKNQLRNNTLKVSWSQLVERKKKHTYFCLLDETNNKPPKNYINDQLISSSWNLKTKTTTTKNQQLSVKSRLSPVTSTYIKYIVLSFLSFLTK